MPEDSLYFKALTDTVGGITNALSSKGIDIRHLHFGGELPVESKIFVPTDARSEFLANRAMGDWAENKLSEAIVGTSQLDLLPVHYGDSDLTAAGEEGFKDQYLAAKEDTRKFGKRPDLLLFPVGHEVPGDISLLPRGDADDFARQATAAIEVRSSKQQALKYMKVKQEESDLSGKKMGKIGLSFTVKVEDLRIVYRWIEVCQIPQIYSQVFFDSVYAINVVDIFRVISTGTGFTIETPAKSQNKATIMIPITTGIQIGKFTTSPDFEVERKETKTGRIDAFVKPVGGTLNLDPSALLSVIHAK